MSKGLPHHNLLAELLHDWHQLVNTHSSKAAGAHPRDLDKVACHIYLQHLYCDLTPFVFALPYFGKPAAIERGIQPIVAERDLDRAW